MQDILSAVYHNDLFTDQVLCNLDTPETPEERKITAQLRAVDSAAAEALRESICEMSDEQAERAFRTGARFGARLMLQLIGGRE